MEKKAFWKDKRLWIGVVVVLAALLAVWGLSTGDSRDVRVIALSELEGGVAPDSAFRLEVDAAPALEELRAAVQTQPDIPFDLSAEESPGSYLLTPLKPLPAGSAFTVTVYDRAFPFQVAKRLLVTSSFPRDGAVGVPVDSGIEFTFNTEELTLRELEAALTIQPAIQGRLDQGNGRFIYYPSQPMNYATNYTVVLDAGLVTAGGATLGEDFALSFQTVHEMDPEMQRMFQIAGNGISVNALASESPLLQVYIDSSIANPEQTVAVTLHTYDDWEAYATALEQSAPRQLYSDVPTAINTAGLTEYAAFDLTPLKAQSGDDVRGYYDSSWVLQFPEPLPAGWYAVTLTLEVNGQSTVRQVFLQVSDLSVFTMALREQMVVWVNDAATGLPVEGAEYRVWGSYLAAGITDAGGVAAITDGVPPGPADEDGRINTFFTIHAGERVFVDSDYYYHTYQDEGAEGRRYMSYLFTDRPLYHTTDTVRVWGMARPRTADTPAPENLTLSLGDGFVTQAVELRPDGTFTATLDIEGMTTSYWTPLALRMGDEELRRESLRIEDFIKPVYTADTAPEQPVYALNAGDTVGVTADVSTFDGTPISAFVMNVSSWSDSVSVVSGETVSTDKQGHARAELRIIADPDTWYPQSYAYEFSNRESQSENFYQQGYVYGVHRDVMLQATPAFQGGEVELAVRTNRVDLSRVQTTEQLWEADVLRGEALSQPVKATLYRAYYERLETGTFYDFIARQTMTSYRHERREEVVETYDFVTAGGAYTLSGLPVSDSDSCYYVEITTADTKGRAVKSTVWLGDVYRFGDLNSGTHRYDLRKQTDPAKATLVEQHGDVTLEHETQYFEDGEDVTYVLNDNDQPLSTLSGRMLYAVIQDDFRYLTVTDSAAVDLPFSEDLLPNYKLTGAYFDGKHIFALEDAYLYFNPRKRELEIRLEPDKASYRPGEELTVAATVTNKVTGLPAAGAEVVLSVVDEAVFAVQEQSSNILRRMYEIVYHPYVRKYTSYLQLNLGGPGEKGGGGDSNMRREFEDTAYFATGTTGADGRVTFSCQLPDNITSWRLTSLALTENGHAGNSKTTVAATKEFFLLPVVNQTLLEGDSFAVGVYAAGTGIDDEDEVHYTVQIRENGSAQTREGDMLAQADMYASLDFGSLPKGEYTVTVNGVCGVYRDGVVLPFTVTESGVERSLVKSFDLAGGINVEPLRYPVSISFYGEGAKTYNTVFQSVHAAGASGRADARLARRYIANQYRKRGAEWYDSAALEADYSDLGGYSMLSLLPYSEPDIELTVRGRLALPDMINAGALEGLDPASSDWFTGARSAIYLGQALAGDPIKTDLSAMLERGEGLDFVDKVYLTMALSVSGDPEAAQGWYDRLVAPHLTELTGLAGDTALYVTPPEGETRSAQDCTAAASLLASMLSTEDADGLARYLAEKKSVYEPYLFEQIYYLEQSAPRQANPSAFTYQRDGQTVTVALDDAFTSLSFNRQQLEEASFTVTEGPVYADVYYAGPPDQGADADKKKIGLAKRIEPVGDGFGVGELVKITLTPDISGLDAQLGDTVLVVDDYIPTGMRFERYDYDFYNESGDQGWYLNSRQGQRLQFTVYGVGGTGLKPLVYYVRCATGGEYVVESAYINSASSDTWGASDRDTVHIQ